MILDIMKFHNNERMVSLITETFFDKIPREEWDKFLVDFINLQRLDKLIEICRNMNLEFIDWKLLHEQGFLCDNDYDIFPELKALNFK